MGVKADCEKCTDGDCPDLGKGKWKCTCLRPFFVMDNNCVHPYDIIGLVPLIFGSAVPVLLALYNLVYATWLIYVRAKESSCCNHAALGIISQAVKEVVVLATFVDP